ncbi:uncharacterized protein LOC126672476 [Mercurialis annua]|uniref:uncharacterized protein LOC126672476 n=1 Tax=Mercurialis annua TaxID=3986 RepID=UPI00215FA69D|nr:uncharacterized protein LOC126672476 [Mercurialis annua]
MVGSYDIKYEPRTSMKAQILADFVAETTTHDQPSEIDKSVISWVLQVDGASNMAGAGAGMILRGPHKIKMQNSIHLNFPATNNSAEYEALIGGLRMATVVKSEYIKIQNRVKELLTKITEEGGKWELEQIPREENTEADTLAKAMLNPKLQQYPKPRSNIPHQPIRPMDGDIISYIENRSLPEDKKEARKMPQSGRGKICLSRNTRRHMWKPHLPSSTLSKNSTTSTWGIDIVGPFPTASGQRKFLIVAVDHFSKWVEAEAVSTITESRVRSFVRKEIICRFGIPRIIITENGKQSDSKNFRDFCTEKGIDLRFTKVTHPQSNVMTEVTNRTIVNGLKKRLDEAKGRWADELHSVLWSYRTMPKAGTGRTPYSLTYGCEAMVPIEIGMPTIRVQYFKEQQNKENTRLCLDLLEERREQALLHIEAYKQRMATYHNKRVKPLTFEVGDLVLRRADIARGNAGVSKLGANWEGPYQVKKVGKGGAYYLTYLSGRDLPRTWNARVLTRFY